MLPWQMNCRKGSHHQAVTFFVVFVTIVVFCVGIVTDWCDSMTMVLLFGGYCHGLTQNCDNAGCFCLNYHRISVLCDRVVPLDAAHGLAA